MTHEPLFQYMQDAKSPDEKVARLLTVEENIIGPENKRELATFIMPHDHLHAFEEQAAQRRAREAEARGRASGRAC